MNFRMRKSWLAPFCLSLSLAACGGGDDSGDSGGGKTPPEDNTPAASIEALERDGSLPALDRSASLAGVDADGNGVRDDIQAWVAQLPASDSQQQALLQLAAANQQALLVDVADEPALRQVVARQMAGVKCVVRREADVLNGQNIVTGMRDRTANTEVRARAYMRYMEAVNGYVMKSPDGNGCSDE